MLSKLHLASSLVGFCLTTTGMTLAASAASAETFDIDPQHSEMIFRIGHFQISGVYGRFNNLVGSFELDANGDLMAASASVKSNDIDTQVPLRDLHVKAQYIDALPYPDMTFKSTSVKKVADNQYRVSGDLTLHGVTKQITITANKTGVGKGMMGEKRVGAETKFSIKRSDYGMGFGIPDVGDEVQAWFNIEGIAK